MMKNNIRKYTSAAFICLTLITARTTQAQTAVKETVTTTTTAGTISEFGPDTIIVSSKTSKLPLRYTYSKTTTYVDELGQPVSMTTVKSGLPVTVYYTRDGDRMVATKVIVRKAEPLDEPVIVTKKTTTTTTDGPTGEGTISEFGPEMFVVRTTTSPEPVRYVYSKTTTYVNEAGEPVSMETVKSGVPVTIQYRKDGDRMIATKVTVRKVVTTK